jgi:hypothetical protein
MRRYLQIALCIFSFALSVILVEGGCLMLFMASEAEWGHISRTGTYSSPEKFIWGEWRPNDEGVRRSPALSDPDSIYSTITEFRKGIASTFFFKYTAFITSPIIDFV